MTQGVLPFKYEEEKTQIGMTSLAGLPVYLAGGGFWTCLPVVYGSELCYF